jgi:Raf kinase inhibitor-like YbhB/YbcL family protein
MSRELNRTVVAGLLVAAFVAAPFLMLACGGEDGEPAGSDTEGHVMGFRLTSSAFDHEATMPTKHTGEGEDVSPPLAWTEVPEGTAGFALICDDPDAPVGTWNHWLIWDIPADARALPEGVPQEATVEAVGGARQGTNSFSENNVGYRGPMPSAGHGTHHYHFRLYALDAPLGLEPGADRDAFLEALEDRKVLGEAVLTGLYERN